MRSKFLLVLVFITAAHTSFSQTKLSGTYQLNGDVSAIKNAYKVYMSYRDKDGNHETDSVLVQNGHFVFKGAVEAPKGAQLMLLTKYKEKAFFKEFCR